MQNGLHCWLQSSLKRVYPASPALDSNHIKIPAARNDHVSFQACIRNETPGSLDLRVSVAADPDIGILVRRVGYVPMKHLNTQTEPDQLEGVGYTPGYVPEPLFPEANVLAGPFETNAFWVTVTIPEDAQPGIHTLEVSFTSGEEQINAGQVSIEVYPLVVKPTAFPVTHWFYADAICDWYKVEPFDEPFWKLCEAYIADYVQHGGSSLYVPLFTPPTDGVKRPTQLLRVSPLLTKEGPGEVTYAFDFTDVKRWVDTGRRCGAQYFEWTHFFTQWGVKNAIRIYRDNADPSSLLWPPETEATSDVYCGFLSQFLPQFHAFLDAEGLLDCSFFHVSDEPHAEDHLANYRAARQMLRELAPWMKVMDALSEVVYGKEGLTDIPVPSIASAQAYKEAGIPSWVYYCCGPRGRFLNRHMDTPLAKIRMHGWLFRKLEAQGFLHWGYNYWYKSQTQQLIDPFTEQSGDAWPGWCYGDTSVVYPGPNGPIDSIRWEVFSESIRDLALLETAGIAPDDPILAEINAYDDFPSAEDWISSARRAVLARAAG